MLFRSKLNFGLTNDKDRVIPKKNPCLYAILVVFDHEFCMVIGTGLRAIKPLRRQKFRFAVLLPTLEVLKSNSGLTNNYKDWV